MPLLEKKRNFEAISYLISRGHNLTTAEGIDCKDLSSIDLSIQNGQGQTIAQLTEDLLSGTANPKALHTLNNIKDIIHAADTNSLDNFFSERNIFDRDTRKMELKHGSLSSDNPAMIRALMQAEVNTRLPLF